MPNSPEMPHLPRSRYLDFSQEGARTIVSFERSLEENPILRFRASEIRHAVRKQMKRLGFIDAPAAFRQDGDTGLACGKRRSFENNPAVGLQAGRDRQSSALLAYGRSPAWHLLPGKAALDQGRTAGHIWKCYPSKRSGHYHSHPSRGQDFELARNSSLIAAWRETDAPMAPSSSR